MPIRLSGMASGLDTDAIIKELMSAQSLKKTNIEGNKKKLEWKKEKWEEMNTKLYALYTEKLSSLKLQGSFLTHKAASSDESKLTATAEATANGTYTVEVESMANAQYMTGRQIKAKNLTLNSTLSEAGMGAGQTITVTKNGDPETAKTFEVDSESTVKDFVDFLKSAGLNANFTAEDGRFFVGSKTTGEANSFTLMSDFAGEDGLAALGLMNIDTETAKTNVPASSADEIALVAASDAKVKVNGAVITNSVNSIKANGLTFELKGVTSQPVSVTVTNDSEGIYNKVKEFVKSYNELMQEMYDKYNAKSARDYKMLTDEEKEEMSDKQIELWEDKIKDSLLRRDDTLNSLMSIFRGAMQKTVEVDGKTYSLSSFGIGTGAYTEHGLLHIDGDADDGLYASKDDKLKSAINSDPELVAKVMSGVFSEFYKTLSDKMSASSISSALTFYNDKQIQSQITDYDKSIKSWETRLTDLEDKYYKQFSAMESAMAKLQSQQSQLAGLLGMS
ncbi:MAG: flagellar filament capping protein FliD [Lachnospiraceae bacterium]|nr:flagellar filament capping protein FliD [Lachnospiraceae bacterium]